MKNKQNACNLHITGFPKKNTNCNIKKNSKNERIHHLLLVASSIGIVEQENLQKEKAHKRKKLLSCEISIGSCFFLRKFFYI